MNRLRTFILNLKNKRVIVFLFLVIATLVFFMFYQKKTMEHQMDLKIQFIEQKNILRDELDAVSYTHLRAHETG